CESRSYGTSGNARRVGIDRRREHLGSNKRRPHRRPKERNAACPGRRKLLPCTVARSPRICGHHHLALLVDVATKQDRKVTPNIDLLSVLFVAKKQTSSLESLTIRRAEPDDCDAVYE